jgi:hypothetical protein
MLQGIVRSLAFAALLFATTATAGERCVNYVSGVQSLPREMSFVSFNPRTKVSVVVAKIGVIPDHVVWPINFGFVTYQDQALGN